MIIIDILCGIMIILALICFIYPKVGCYMAEIILLFSDEIVSARPDDWMERRITRIRIRILSLFFIGLMIMVIVTVNG